MSDPRPTKDLNDAAAWPFRAGAEEIVIRVSRYTGDSLDKIGCYQAIVKHRRRGHPGGVGVAGDIAEPYGLGMRANPVAALSAAIDDFYHNIAKAGVQPMDQEETGPEDTEVDDDVEDLLA